MVLLTLTVLHYCSTSVVSPSMDGHQVIVTDYFYSAFVSPLPIFPFGCFLPLASPFVLQLLLQCIVAKNVELYYEGYRLFRSSESQQYATKRLHVSSYSSVFLLMLLLLLLLLISSAELAS